MSLWSKAKERFARITDLPEKLRWLDLEAPRTASQYRRLQRLAWFVGVPCVLAVASLDIGLDNCACVERAIQNNVVVLASAILVYFPLGVACSHLVALTFARESSEPASARLAKFRFYCGTLAFLCLLMTLLMLWVVAGMPGARYLFT